MVTMHDLAREDDQLVEEALGGNALSFQLLVERYQERIFALARHYTKSAVEVEDIAQDTFLKAYRRLDSFQRQSSFSTWLYRIAVNTATDYLSRHRRRRLHLVETDAELDAARDLDKSAGSVEPLLDDELRQVTRQVLDTLPEKYRTILILREFEDLSYTEMAEVLQCSIGTVESRLFRARGRFKEALERVHPDLVPGVSGARTRGESRKGVSPR